MDVVFRTDASTEIGSGHVMRCLTLAERLRRERGAVCRFICRAHPGHLIGLIRVRGFSVFELPPAAPDAALTGYARWLGVSQERDAEETVGFLRGLSQRPDWLVADSYALDAAWERRLRPYTGRVFVIDDLANRKHDCDVLLDQNFYLDAAHRYDGLVPETCALLLGPKHALLREEFYEARRSARVRTGELRHILVFYGGSDRTNETMKALRALAEARLPSCTAQVIVGGGNPHRAEVEAFCARYPWLEYHCQVQDMAARMNAADLMLGAGGTTTWERCFLGLPAIVTAIAENQEAIAEACADVGYLTYLGRAAEVTEDDLLEAVRALTPHCLREQEARMRGAFADGESGYGAIFA